MFASEKFIFTEKEFVHRENDFGVQKLVFTSPLVLIHKLMGSHFDEKWNAWFSWQILAQNGLKKPCYSQNIAKL